jgi:hypothetical protein
LFLVAAVLACLGVAACGGGGGENGAGEGDATATRVEPYAAAQTVEADSDPSLPGEYVDLPAIYGGAYGESAGDTADHVREDVDYSAQGLPPAGGPHWGTGACTDDPATSPQFCGPAPWGIFRDPWEPETVVHNMEHAGAIIWYNTADQAVIDDLEAYATDLLRSDMRIILTPYPEMEPESVAITVWSRRDIMPASEYSRERLQTFLDALYCRFDPERFCR